MRLALVVAGSARDLEQFDLLFRGQRRRLPARQIDPKSGMEIVN